LRVARRGENARFFAASWRGGMFSPLGTMTLAIPLENSAVLQLDVPPPCKRESFFVFSMHKAGSVMLNRAMEFICAELGIPSIIIPRAAFRQGIPDEAYNASAKLGDVLFPNGYCYQYFRYFPPFLASFFENPRLAVLLIRDPRDMLTSLYFSVAYSHRITGGDAGNLQDAEREQALQVSIDDFVLEKVDFIRQEFISYDTVLASERTRLFRYEDVVFSKVAWIRDILDFLGETLPEESVGIIARKVDRQPEAERPDKHVRKVTPGDHKEKLRPETITRLNDAFADILKRFGYATA
jgi:Sulfotransferase domain